MIMRRLILSFIAACVLIALAARSEWIYAQSGNSNGTLSTRAQTITPQARDWLGVYEYTESPGRTAGGTGIVILHEIYVYEEEGRLFARITANGYQTSRAMRCDARVEGNRLRLYLNRYEEDNMFEPYRVSQLLLTLERRQRSGRTTILTHWHAMQPVAAERPVPNGRVYFRRTRSRPNA
jgi:hypothetical protein